jgi:hypothetical protein
MTHSSLRVVVVDVVDDEVEVVLVEDEVDVVVVVLVVVVVVDLTVEHKAPEQMPPQQSPSPEHACPIGLQQMLNPPSVCQASTPNPPRSLACQI